jgi:pyrroline-5-carboxylate reductase
MRIGFVGTGSITKAVVTGLCRSKLVFEGISLSPRNAKVADMLASTDTRIRVCSNNQQVVDTSDVVCIGVLPEVAPSVIEELKLRSDQTVISFVAGLKFEQLIGLLGNEVAVARAIPLPATAIGSGSTAIYPPNEIASTIFSAIGSAVAVTEEQQFDAFSAVTATMSSYYTLIEEQAQWLTKRGIPYDDARKFLAQYYIGLASPTGTPFSQLAKDHSTPGGINELMHDKLGAEGVFNQFGTALDVVWKRLESK